MSPATEADPMCLTCKVEMVNMGAPPTGKDKNKSVYVCPKCRCTTATSGSSKARTPAKKSKQGVYVPGCPKCQAKFVEKATPGEIIYCSICEYYFAYNVRGKLVQCDELGTIYKQSQRRRKRKKQLI